MCCRIFAGLACFILSLPTIGTCFPYKMQIALYDVAFPGDVVVITLVLLTKVPQFDPGQQHSD